MQYALDGELVFMTLEALEISVLSKNAEKATLFEWKWWKRDSWHFISFFSSGSSNVVQSGIMKM